MVNPTGQTPWASGSPNVVYLNFDHSLAPDENYFIFCNPFSDFAETVSYGDTLYVSTWIWFNTSNLLTASFRKTIYINFNVSDQTHLGSLVIDQYPHSSDGSPGVIAVNQRGGGILIPGTGATGTVTGNAWHYWETGLLMDSAPGANDGQATVWFDDESTPLIGPTTTQYTESNFPSSRTTYNANSIEIGSQLENGTVAEMRYLGPTAISRQRIGKVA
jgi:hypothetical protein